MASTRQETRKPLWQSGSHVSRRSTGTGNTITHSGRPARVSDPAADCESAGDVDQWMRNHPADPDRLRPEDLPGGEVVAKVSGVFGVYGALPQATCRLFERFMDSERQHVGTTRYNVPRRERNNALLAATLATPLLTHRFA